MPVVGVLFWCCCGGVDVITDEPMKIPVTANANPFHLLTAGVSSEITQNDYILKGWKGLFFFLSVNWRNSFKILSKQSSTSKSCQTVKWIVQKQSLHSAGWAVTDNWQARCRHIPDKRDSAGQWDSRRFSICLWQAGRRHTAHPALSPSPTGCCGLGSSQCPSTLQSQKSCGWDSGCTSERQETTQVHG